MYLIDYHLHTKCSEDSQTTLLQQAQAAIAAGVRELCVTDHWNLLSQAGYPLPRTYDWRTALVRWKRVRNDFPGQLEIRFGIEIGNGVVDPAAVEEALHNTPELDFAIGSIHNQSLASGGLGTFTAARQCRTKEDCIALLQDYMNTLEELAHTSGYDVLGHIIYPLRYLPPEYSLTLHPWWDQLAAILKHVIATGRGIECNTSQGSTVEEWRDVLALYRDLGGEILTLGSDAHRPDQIAAAFPGALALIQTTGFRYLTTYRSHTPLFAALD